MADLIPPIGTGWQSLKLQDVVPKEVPEAINQAVSTIESFISAYTAALSVAKKVTGIVSTSANIIDTALAQLVTALKNLVQSLLYSRYIHVLFVPIPKVLPASNALTSIPKTLLDTANVIGADYTKVADALSSGANSSYTQLATAPTGGNAAFFRTVSESLFDEKDSNRPNYPAEDAAIACAVVMTGAASVTELLNASTAFNRLFRPTINMATRVVPIPQNVKAKLVGAANVKLDWDAPTPVFTSPYFPIIVMRVVKYAVIRTTNKDGMSARSVLDIFTTNNLTQGLIDGESKVLAVGAPSNNSYVDGEVLDSNKTYYYCVAWQVSVQETNETTILPWGAISAMRQINPKKPSSTTSGTPPDWQALKSPIEIFPVLGQQLERLLAEVESIATRRVSTYSNIVTTAADGVLASLQELTNRLHDLTLKLATFSATALSDLPGIYSTAFLGQGGTTFLLGELSNLLTNKSDDGRPPFDSNEYVIGMVIVAGGPRIPDVQPTYELLKTLFNLPKFDSPLYTILNEIDALVTRTETYAFNADMTPAPVGAAVAATPVPTTFALDCTPITADDPTNPNSGFTNNPDPDFVPC